MSNDLFNQSSGGTAEDRRAEADRICAMLGDDLELMEPREQQFVQSLIDDESRPVTPKMLFWLRDIKDKYL